MAPRHHHHHPLPCDDRIEFLGVDGNGAPTERRWVNGVPVIIHYEDHPESDVTVHRGIRCTTPIRTVIDLAVSLSPHRLAEVVADCLHRGLFTARQAWERLDQPDMAEHRGAELVRRHLPPRR